MEEFIKAMAEKVGISEEQANSVVEFLKEHASQLPAMLGNSEMLGGLGDKLKDFLGGE